MKVIGLTGSISCGKTYAMNMFSQFAKRDNISIDKLNIDEVRREILDNSYKYKELNPKFQKTFGNSIFSDNHIDRNKLNKVIYANEDNMLKYKNIINPYLKSALRNSITQDSTIYFLEWALLAEDKLEGMVNVVIVFVCSEDKQFERLKDSDLSKEELLKRINMQYDNEQKIREIERTKDVIVFDTTNDPEESKYKEIFDKIVKEVMYE